MERSVDARSTPDQIQESIAIARWIGLAFDDMSGIREQLLGEQKRRASQHELAARIASGEVSPGGTEYMEPDSAEETLDGTE